MADRGKSLSASPYGMLQRAMKPNDLLGALAYKEWRERQRASTPRDPAVAGVLALCGVVVSLVVMGAFLWLVLAICAAT